MGWNFDENERARGLPEVVWTPEKRARLRRRIERVRLAKLAKTKGYAIDWLQVKDEDLSALWATVVAYGGVPHERARSSLAPLLRDELDRVLEPVATWRRSHAPGRAAETPLVLS